MPHLADTTKAVLSQPNLNAVSHSLAVTVRGEELALFPSMFNAYWEPLELKLPWRTGGEQQGWRRWMDTPCDAPDDSREEASAPRVEGERYTVHERRLVMLVALRDGRSSPRARAKRLVTRKPAR